MNRFPSPARHRQDGSIALALLASMVVGGLALVLLVNVANSQQLTRKDRDYNVAIHVADAGLQQALTELSQLDPTAAPTQTNAGALEDGQYTWTATRRAGTVDIWDVRAEGRFGGETRVLEAEMGRTALFSLAAYGKEFVRVSGGGTGHGGICGGRVCSYDAAGICDFNSTTCLGEIGTAGYVEAGSVAADLVHLYDGAEDRGSSGPVLTHPDEPEYEDLGREAYQAGGPCDGAPPKSWNNDATNGLPFNDEPLIRGNTYCFNEVHFGEGPFQLTNNTDPSKNNRPVTVYINVNGKLFLNGKGGTNPGPFTCTAPRACVNMKTGVPPNSQDLQFYMYGNGTFDIGKNTNMMAAVVYNPNGSCSMSSKAALYGAMVCGTVYSNGGISLYYDEALRNLFADDFGIREWREELRNTTSQ